MKKLVLSVALCSALATAFAAEPYSAIYDEASRVRKVLYSDNLVISVVAYPDRPVMLEFDQSEPILDAAGGTIANWEVAKRGSRLFARPLDEARPTTIVVGTKTRSYVVDLTPGGKVKAPAKFVSKIVITYPTPEVTDEAKSKVTAADIKDGSNPLEESKHSIRNDKYSIEAVSETIDIRPREVFDDGRFTYFRFPENLPVPAIYKSAPGTAEEWLVNSHRDKDYIVVHGIAGLWNLRASGTVLGVFNDAYDPVGIAPTGNTTIQGIKREAR